MSLPRRSFLLAGAGLSACQPLPIVSPQAGLKFIPAPELASLAPAAPREFRAAWVATVANIDWPSRKGLSSAEQQAEVLALLDRASALKLNALILQVRSSADAIYPSALEPWSEYLSGTQGQAPEPFYDPLALWVSEAHRRGIELHVWFNPFRARQSGAKSEAAPQHLSRSQPTWVKPYGDQQWIDPGEPAAAEHALAVIADVLRRYDVDAVHIDDYFYPYPLQDGVSKQEIDFPDEPAWRRYSQAGGALERADWRRQNVDRLVQRIAELVKRTRPWVRFGISPFGLPKPALRPAGIAGFSQYDKLYADVERWLNEGWLDYLAPQLYWPIAQKPQAFGVLLDYWHGQNLQGRHIWPGLFTSKLTDKPDSWPLDEILQQIELVRQRRPGSGHAHFSMVALLQNRRGLADALMAGPYAEAALVPATPWLVEREAPAAAVPQLKPVFVGAEPLFELSFAPDRRHSVWLLYGERWELRLCGELLRVPAAGLSGLVVSALNRIGQEGPRLGLRL
ncbi:glycoside hydrolase family 10 protein [Roseateles oligotrophus]|uniref:Family 10 glycosylhydrolase n=1 Tax=Roseateles oligotrophus TaxID=1769250 RepID=A0ABT2YD61_9BURK|nr:family 10 glycosylhydrolase [Roseateles oligotrophus]MCV2367980.1 family 10 glycosylhydrolase [Roseateles oligotrophus]